MSQTFNPKFVDMVRVSTSTQGTGPLVCGPAVAGFSTFAEALTAGDEFYYAVHSADRPQEREVGKGIYQANNSISRQPLKGALTNFSAGPKTIALVAASEWYSRLQEVSATAGRLILVDTRAAMKASARSAGDVRRLGESGREGDFVWSPLVPVATHQADTAEGIYIAPNATAAGAWVRRFDAAVNIRWFGATGDGLTNDSAAFQAALSILRATAQTGFGYSVGGNRLFVPRGHYFLGTTTLDVTFSLTIEGEGNGLMSGGSTVLRWSAGATGIRVQGGRTVGANGTKADDYVGGRCTIRGLHLRGGYVHGSTPEGEFHGVHLRDTASVQDCYISQFQGDGLFIIGDVNFGNNTNCSEVSRSVVESCRNGVYLQGGDANACSFYHVNVSSNRQWGIFDRSFLGNSFFGCHSATNGTLVDSSGPSVIPANRARHNGSLYAVKPGEEAWCSTNAPSGTSAHNQGWLYLAPFGAEQPWNNIRNWTSGATYRSGGSYAATDVNNRTVFIGCYSEGDMAPNQIYGRGTLYGGIHENGTKGQVAVLKPEYNGLWIENSALRSMAGFQCRGGENICGDDGDQWTSWSIRSSNFAAVDFRIAGTRRASLYSQPSGGVDRLFYETTAVGAHFFNIGSAVTIASITVNGLELASGKELRVNGLKVVGARDTGWTAATGTASKGPFAAMAAGSASASYTQGELQAALNRVAAAEARIVALEAAARGHGLIN